MSVRRAIGFGVIAAALGLAHRISGRRQRAVASAPEPTTFRSVDPNGLSDPDVVLADTILTEKQFKQLQKDGVIPKDILEV